MHLREIAQKIVDATMEVIDNRNVNIMDRDGMIIASGEKNRINTYHKGADDVIKSGKIIEIYPEEVPDYPGAKEGVNLPIRVGDKTVGVVGVYGHPDEVRIIANLVKKAVELNLEQHLLSQQVKLVTDLKQQILRKLIYDKNLEKHDEEILCLSKLVNLDLNVNRYAIILEVKNYSIQDSLEFLKIAGKLEDFLLAQHYLEEGDFYGVLNQYLVVFKKFPVAGFSGEQDLLRLISQGIYRQYGYEIRIARGSFHPGLSGYGKSYQEARTLLKIDDDDSVRDISELEVQVDYLLNQISAEDLEHFVRPIYQKILNKKGRIQPWIIKTLKALFQHNFKLTEAANSLFIHKNTMAYRVKRIEEITGLSISHNFYHTVMLNLLVIYVDRLQKATRT